MHASARNEPVHLLCYGPIIALVPFEIELQKNTTVILFLDFEVFVFCWVDFDSVAASSIFVHVGVVFSPIGSMRLLISHCAIKLAVTSAMCILSAGLASSIFQWTFSLTRSTAWGAIHSCKSSRPLLSEQILSSKGKRCLEKKALW